MATYNKDAIAAYFSKKLLNNFDNYGSAMQCVNRNHESELKDGDTLYINKYGDITINDGATIVHDSSSLSQTEFNIDQIKNFSIPIGKIDKKQANIDLKAGWSQRQKIAMGLVRDTRILSHVAQSSSDNLITEFTMTANNIYDKFVEARENLQLSNSLDDQGKGFDGKAPWIILNPVHYSYLLTSPYATQATAKGDAVIRTGSVKQWAGFDVMLSTNFTAAAAVFNVMYGTNEAISYVSQMEEMRVIEVNKDDFYIYLQGLFVYGSKVLNEAALGKMIVTE